MRSAKLLLCAQAMLVDSVVLLYCLLNNEYP